ncbi:hypothetical protein IV203_003453 [Nitzschia inconspicua]|uniref:Uncharacterized protein n=1 Tax=Nitzschia inconspicua TaxID=303405 RepID=A0A9K3L2B2_9STRA|nr:hypothetical protein IV203_003453 [Nitzschia inconspicua]
MELDDGAEWKDPEALQGCQSTKDKTGEGRAEVHWLYLGHFSKYPVGRPLKAAVLVAAEETNTDEEQGKQQQTTTTNKKREVEEGSS